MKTALLFGLCGLGALSSADALGDDKMACIQAASQGQTLRDTHKLIEARDQFRLCARQACPSVVQSDCAGWLDAVEKSIATVVITATDGAGGSLFNVRVRLDGQPWMEQLDGEAAPVNPGVHTFVFQRADGASVAQTVQVNEGERNQKIAAVLNPASAPPPALPPPSPTVRSRLGTQKILGLVAGGVGVAGVAVGSAFGILTLSEVSQQQSDCATKTNCPHPTQGSSDHSTAMTDRTISTVGFVAGGALLMTGAVLFFTANRASEPPTASAMLVVPTVGPGGGGVSWIGKF